MTGLERNSGGRGIVEKLAATFAFKSIHREFIGLRRE
jgi:hypothetical protein